MSRTRRQRSVIAGMVAITLLFGLFAVGVWAVREQPTCGNRFLDRVGQRDTARPNLTGSFPTDDGRVLGFDFYRPPGDLHNERGEPPLIIYVHGGGWSSLDKTLGRSTPPLVLCERGYAVASIDYRRTSDGVSWPTPAADVAATVRTLGLSGNSDDLRFDRERVALWGDSAGGHLASFVALAANNSDGPQDLVGGRIDLGEDIQVRGVIGGAAITDLTDPTFATWAEDIPGVERCPAEGEGDPDSPCDAFAHFWPCISEDQQPGRPNCTTVIEASMLWLLGCAERDTSTCGQVQEHPLAEEASPIQYVDPCDPPHMLLSDSELPEFVDDEFTGDLLVPPSQQQRLVEVLDAAGVDTSFSRSTDGSGHLAITTADADISALDAFLEASFSGEPPPGC